MAERILLIEDDAAFRDMLTEALTGRGFRTDAAGTAEDGLALLSRGGFDLVLTDVRLPGMTGIEAIPRMRRAAPETDIIVMTAYSAKESAVEAVRLGAYDFFAKPFSLAELEVVVRRALERRRLSAEVRRLQRAVDSGGPLSRIIGQGRAMESVKEQVARVAPLQTTVLVTGESGTGKELISETIHALSPRAAGPMVRVNCAAIPENLLESELFGHRKGAFTGAGEDRAGRFEQAHKGTLLLDEIGDMPLSVQPKILRAVEGKLVERLGGGRPLAVDVRIVAATNQDLAALISQRCFREDLYYRLNVAAIHLPPLRQRLEDVPALAEHVVSRLRLAPGVTVEGLEPEATARLMEHHWPGNVRQLANVLERASITAQGRRISADDVERALAGPSVARQPAHAPQPALPGPPLDGSVPLKQRLAGLERQLILQALEQAGGRQTEAARLLGIGPKNLWNKLQKHGIDPKDATDTD